MPLREMVQNMQGLAALAEQRRQAKIQDEQLAKQKTGMEALNQYIETEKKGAPDMSLFYKAVTAVPEAASNVLKGIGIDEKRKAQDASQFVVEAAPLVENRDAFVQKLKGRIDYLRANNRPSAESESLLEQYLAGDVAGVKNNLKGVAGALVGTGNLDAKAYEYAFGPPEEKISALDREKLDLEKQKIGLMRQNNAATIAGTMGGTSNQKDWNTYQNLLKTDPAAAKAFGRAAGFESKEGQQLTGFSEKQISTASDEYNNASSAAGRYATLAEQIRAKSIGGGLPSSWAETLKDLSGNQDEITQLKRSVMEVVNSEAIKALPPGPATDRDIALVREPFPTARANGEYIANWLGAVARLNEKRAQYAEHKAQFIAQNGGQRNSQGETVLSSWKKLQSAQEPAKDNKKQGGVLHVDANGNRAIVYPDGSYEEVK